MTAPAAAQAPRLPVELSGATRLEYQEAGGIVVADGSPVVVTRGQTVVRAPRIRYEVGAQTIEATGGVEVVEPGLALRGATAVVRLADESVRVAGGVVARSQREGEDAVLEAAQLEGSLATRRFVATGAVAVRRGPWTVSGQRIDYDARTTAGTVTGDPRVQFRDATMTAGAVTFNVAQEVARGEGAVRLRRGEIVATAPRVDMNGRSRQAVLSGGATVERGRDRLTAATIDVDLDTDRVTARGSPHLVVHP
jgi:lipopolysaccharide assembly outer membrane protein LptD (OstA)